MIEDPAKLKKTPLPETIANWQNALTPVFDMTKTQKAGPILAQLLPEPSLFREELLILLMIGLSGLFLRIHRSLV
jgi:hypothetical protein